MRVDLTTYGVEPPDKSHDHGKTSRASHARHEAETSLDQASFSFDQARVQALKAQAMAQPEMRDQKVELLRQAIGKGEYAVSENQIADAVLADVRGGSALR